MASCATSTAARVGKVLLLVTYAYFVLSNAAELRDWVPMEYKHALFASGALVSLLIRPRQALTAAVVASPLAALYFIGGAPLYGGMVFVFAASLPIICEGLKTVLVRRETTFLLCMLALSLLPALLAAPLLLEQGLMDSTYGRDRMLLGYWHPKEAGIAFGIPLLLFLLSARSKSPLRWVAAVAFIWVVGSRNVAMLIAIGYLIRFFPRFVAYSIALAFLAAGLVIGFDPDWHDAADTLLSLRLTVWEDILTSTQYPSELDIFDGERFGADNFFVEGMVFGGLAAPPLIATWMTICLVVSGIRNELGSWPRIAFALLVFFAFFDSGIASTGNLMHAVLWAIMLCPLLTSSRKNCVHPTPPQSSSTRKSAPLELLQTS